jgi:hypothetical protein
MQQLGWFDDFKKGLGQASDVLGQVADAGRQVSGVIDQVSPQVMDAWKMIDKDSHSKYAGDVQAGLDASKQTWGLIDQSTGMLDQAAQGKIPEIPSGMYIPDFGFQQQQMQNLLSW